MEPGPDPKPAVVIAERTRIYPLFPCEQVVLFLVIILPVSVYIGYRLGRATYIRNGLAADTRV